jgi:PST family polysaccharide transporter
LTEPTGQNQPIPLGKQVARSGAWIYGRNLVTSLINLGVTAILARQLTPADFGLVALANVLLRFVVIFAEGGISAYIISDNREGRENRVQAAFWMNLFLSIAVTLVGLFALPWITRFFDEPGLRLVLILLGVRYLILQVALAPSALVKKELRFDQLVIIDSTIEIASSVLSVILALMGWGVLSLVVPGVLLAPLRAVWFMYVAHWVPRLPLRTSEWRGIFRYSANVIGGSLATTIGAEGDTLVVGKVLGSQSLGLYNIAWTSANMVHRNLISPLSGIALPAYSSLAQDINRMKPAFLRMIRLLSTISFPLLVGLFVVADLFILTVYGPQWIPSITPLRILIVYALRYAIGSPANAVFYAVRRPDLPLKFGLAFIPFYLTCILIGSVYDFVGVAIGVTVARTLFGLIQLAASARLAGSQLGEALRQAAPALLAACCMGLGVALVRVILVQFAFLPVVELVLSVFAGGVIYLALLVFVFRGLREELLSMIEALSPRLGMSARRVLAFR